MLLVCLLFLLVKGGLTAMNAPGFFDVDLVAVTVAYIVAWYGDSWAAVFALVMGLVIDILSAAPVGFFAIIYLILFAGIRVGDALFDLQTVRGLLMVVFLSVLIGKFLFIGFLNLYEIGAEPNVALIFSFTCSAAFSAVAAPAVSFSFDTVARMLSRVRLGRGEEQP